VRVGKIIPADGFQQTVAGRRKRFRDNLRAAMAASGWSVGTTGGASTPAAFSTPETNLDHIDDGYAADGRAPRVKSLVRIGTI